MTTAVQGLKPENLIDELRDRIEQGLDSGSPRRIRALLREHSNLPSDRLLKELLEAEVLRRQKLALTIAFDEYLTEFADHRAVVAEVFNRIAKVESDVQLAGSTGPAAETRQCNQDPTPPTPPTVVRGPKPNMPLSIGRYRIERLLGTGGNGNVYLGFDPRLKIEVAVKVPRSSVSATTTPLHEAATLAQLNHPNVVRIYGVEPDDQGRQCIIQEYIDGQDLNTRIENLSSKNQAMAVDQAVMLIATVADALAYLHRKHVIHRDIKPHNILLDREGQPHLVDFGLALLWTDVGSSKPGGGTLLYIAPEQLRNPNWVDGSCDIFSLGAVLYELLVGEPPFGRKGRKPDEIIATIDCAEVRPPRQARPEIPAEIERICLKALAKDPTQRYTSAADMASELRAALRPASTTPRAPFYGLAVAGLAAAVWFGGFANKDHAPISRDTREAPASVASAAAPLVTNVEMEVFYKYAEERQYAEDLLNKEAMPLSPGDLVYLQARTDAPAYYYVYRFDVEGVAHRKWPATAGNSDAKRERISCPTGDRQYWELQGQPGYETMFVGVSETPLTSKQITALDQLQLKPLIRRTNELREFEFPESGRTSVRRSTTRGPTDNIVESSKGLFGDAEHVLQSAFKAYHGWVFYHE